MLRFKQTIQMTLIAIFLATPVFVGPMITAPTNAEAGVLDTAKKKAHKISKKAPVSDEAKAKAAAKKKEMVKKKEAAKAKAMAKKMAAKAKKAAKKAKK